MEQKIEQNLVSVAGKLAKIRDFFNAGRDSVKKVLKKTMYWGGVGVVGIAIAGVIMKSAGMPIVAPAEASLLSLAATLLGIVIYILIIAPIGMATLIVLFVMQLMIWYPYYLPWDQESGAYVNVSAVVLGWKLVRDVCNIFFSVILVLIALATVLKIEAYSWKKMLPKFILMAILINFSKSICGIFTDLSTVAMATFAGSFLTGFAGGLLSAFGLVEVKNLKPTEGNQLDIVGAVEIVFAFVMAAIFTMVFFVVMIVFTIILMFRIVMLWFLIVLSPIAYLVRTVPSQSIQAKSSEWWKKFGQYCAVGPLVTFFLWLSLTLAFTSDEDEATEVSSSSAGGLLGYEDDELPGGVTPPSSTKHSTDPSYLANFLVATMMLMASLHFIHEMASEAGKITGAVEQGAWKVGGSLMKKSGQVMMGAGAAFGKAPPKEGEEDTRKGYEKFFHRASGGLAALGMVMQPTVMFNNVKDALGKREERQQRDAIETARGQFLDYLKAPQTADNEVAGQGERVKAWAKWGVGMVGATGAASEHMMDNYYSGQGIRRIGRLFRRRGDKEEADKIDEDIKEKSKDIAKGGDADRALQQHSQQLTVDELREISSQLSRMNEDDSGLQDLIETLDRGGDTDVDAVTANIVFDAALEGLNAELEQATGAGDTDRANRIREDMEDINEYRNSELADPDSTVSISDLAGWCVGTSSRDGREEGRRRSSVMDTIRESAQQRLNANGETREDMQERLDATGVNVNVTFDENGKFEADSHEAIADAEADANTTTDAEREEAAQNIEDIKKEIEDLRSQRDKLYRGYNAALPGDDYYGRVERQRLVNEKGEQIKDIKNTEELRDHLRRAIDSGDQYLAEACLRRITKLGDLNEVTQNDMSDDPNASSDADGLENFRQKILMGELGMTADQSYTLANDLTYDAEEIGHLGYARAYRLGPHGWGYVRDDYDEEFKQNKYTREYELDSSGNRIRNEHYDPSKMNRSDAVIGETIKRDPTQWLKFNRLAWGVEDSRRGFHITKIGEGLLRHGGKDLAQHYNWQRFNANAKLRLSQDNVINRLEGNVASEFTSALRGFSAELKRAKAAAAGAGPGRQWQTKYSQRREAA